MDFGWSNISGSSVVVKSTTRSAVNTGDINNNIVFSSEIDGGSLSVNDLFEYCVVCSGATTFNFVTRTYINTQDNLSGATLLHTYNGGGNFTQMFFTARIGIIRSATQTVIYPPTVSGAFGRDTLVLGGVSPSIVNVDWSQKQYFIVTHQLSNSSGQSYVEGFYFLKR